MHFLRYFAAAFNARGRRIITFAAPTTDLLDAEVREWNRNLRELEGGRLGDYHTSEITRFDITRYAEALP